MVDSILVQSVDQLAARFESEAPQPDAEPFKIEDYLPALEQLNQTLQQATLLVGQVDKTSAPLVEQLVSEINLAAEKRVDHVFWRMVWLLILIGCITLVLIVVHHQLKKPRPRG